MIIASLLSLTAALGGFQTFVTANKNTILFDAVSDAVSEVLEDNNLFNNEELLTYNEVKTQKTHKNNNFDLDFDLFEKMPSRASIDDKPFVGIIMSKERCVSLYQTVSKMIYLAYPSNDGNVADGFIRTFVFGLISSAISSITSFVSGMVADFLSFFSLGGLVGAIISSITSVIGAVVVIFLVVTYAFGHQNKGFAFGFKINSFFSWQFTCRVLE